LTESRTHPEQRDRFRTLKWTFLVSSAVVAVAVDHLAPGWGRPVVLTLLIFGALIGFGRPYWCTAFWAVSVGAFTVHIALMARFHTVVSNLTFPELFLWAVGEIVTIAIILGIVFPDNRESPLQH
jgi:hypothetical protein